MAVTIFRAQIRTTIKYGTQPAATDQYIVNLIGISIIRGIPRLIIKFQASSYGPIGILVVIPLLLIYYGCDRKARARTVQRARENLTAQNIMADKKKVSDMLQVHKKSFIY